jgi:hypothetical protein
MIYSESYWVVPDASVDLMLNQINPSPVINAYEEV